MTKKEQAEMERLKQELRLARAFHFTEPVEPDVAPPDSFQGLRKGFLFNDYTDQVDIACTSSIYHAWGRDDDTTTQGSRYLYSTRLLALRGLRYEVERKVAERLAKIDQRIEKELKTF